MANFLVIVAPRNRQADAERLLADGIAVAHAVAPQSVLQQAQAEGVAAALVQRHRSFPGGMASAPAGACWLLASGTWFHADGYGPGDEARLAERYAAVGAEKLASELEGFFVLVVHDRQRQETVLITDIVGSCHAFLRRTDGCLAIAGSSLVLAALDKVTLDVVACQEYLNTGIIYEDRTLYGEIRKLAPATIYRLRDGEIASQQRYWKIDQIEPESISTRAAPRLLMEALAETAGRIAGRYGNPVCDLTGGYDSRALAAAFRAAGVRFSTTVSGPADSADVTVSRGIAQQLGLPHQHLSSPPLTFQDVCQALPYTDGEYDVVEYARILGIHKILSQQFEISVNGSFGEVARGYWWELLWPAAGKRVALDAHKVASRRYAAQPYDATLFPPETRLDLVAHFVGIIERTNAGLQQFPNTVQMDHAYLMMRMQRWQGRIASSTDRLWPCVSPFQFRPVLETMLRAPVQLRRRSLLIRHMLVQFQPELANYPLEHGNPAVPVTWKTMHRFAPLALFYGEKVVARIFRPAAKPPQQIPARLRLWQDEGVQELLHADRLHDSGLLDRAAVARFVEQSRAQSFAHGDQWGRLLSLQLTLKVLRDVRGTVASRA